jgi:hypothetical protein
LFLSVDSDRVIPGKATLALALVALAGIAAPEVFALCVAIAVCFLYADLPEALYDRFLQYVPVYNSMRGTNRIRGVITFMLYLLAAQGFHALLSSTARSRPDRLRWGFAAAVALGLVALAWVYDSRFLGLYALTGLAFAAIAAAVSWRSWPMGAVSVLLLTVMTLEAGTRFKSRTEFGSASHYKVNADYAEFARHKNDIDRVLFVPSPIRQPHGPAITLLTGHRNVEGYHALTLYRYAEFFQAAAGIQLNQVDDRGRLEVQGRYPVNWVTPETFAVLDLFNVRSIVRLGQPIPLLKYAVDNGSSKFSVAQYGRLVAYTNHEALPPIFPIHEAGTVESDAFAHRLIREGALDYRRQATLPPGTPMPPLAPATGPEPLTLRQYGPNAMEVDVLLTAPALLVMSEMWYPGWYAQVDGGEPQPTLCVNTVLQATPVPAGTHRVRFFYRPPSFIHGVIVSGTALGVALVCVLALVVSGRRRKSPARDDESAEPS